jgi:hypothetical protein
VLDLLDRWEDDLYERRAVEVRLAGGRCLAAFAYVVSSRRAELVTDLPWQRLR